MKDTDGGKGGPGGAGGAKEGWGPGRRWRWDGKFMCVCDALICVTCRTHASAYHDSFVYVTTLIRVCAFVCACACVRARAYVCVCR